MGQMALARGILYRNEWLLAHGSSLALPGTTLLDRILAGD